MVKSIKWNNHHILGNLGLDFTKPDGSSYNTIILAGENGVGKTTILDTISAFLNLGSIEPFEYIIYEINGVTYTITPYTQNANLGFHLRKNNANGNVKNIFSNRQNNYQSIEKDLEDIRHYGVSYSKARTGFSTKTINSTTTQQIDSDKYEADKNDDFTSIKQLLVDINSQDNSEWMHLCRSNSQIELGDFLKTSKSFRFENAFNSFFDSIKYSGVDNNNPQELKIIFEKFGKQISIDDLSTGEKQIVFRGTYLLKNSNNLSGGIVLIDEPELSMHPLWQQKVLQYYRNLFTKDGEQSVQLIISTHSQYVLSSALADTDNTLVIALSNDNGNIVQKRIITPGVLPSITEAETNYLVFDILSNDYHIELYGHLQNIIARTNSWQSCSVKQCDDYIKNHQRYKPTIHNKQYIHTHAGGNNTTYDTLPTFIRNTIDHPDPSHTFTPEELKTSIELLIELCR